MLKELLNTNGKLTLGKDEYSVRFNLNSMLYLEMHDLPFDFIMSIDHRKWDIDTVEHLVRACMCSHPSNSDAVNRRAFEEIKPDLYALGNLIRAQDLPALREELNELITDAFPPPESIPKDKKSKEATDEGHMRAIYCDIMHRPDEEFWDNTIKTNLFRINHYLEAKGLKEKPVEIQYIDKDD